MVWSRLYLVSRRKNCAIDQLALLVGMVKGPSHYNPMRYPERAKERRDFCGPMMDRTS